MDLHGWIFENLLYVAGRVHEPIFYERLCGEAQPLAQPRHSNPSSVNRSSSFRENVVADALYAVSGIVCHCRESDVSGPPYGNLRLVTPKLRLEIQGHKAKIAVWGTGYIGLSTMAYYARY